jgi:hypothetical protein
MKTAACWIGNYWTIRTTKLGTDKEFTLSVDVTDVARGNLGRSVTTRDVDEDKHYTVIEISQHHRPLRGRTVSKVKEYLQSIYRIDISECKMRLIYNSLVLEWPGYNENEFLKAKDGTVYHQPFIFEIPTEPAPKVVEGWVGVLATGSRSRAGFSIMHRKRLIKGWPDSWRPEHIYGAGGRNDLINQRLVGEVNLEDFEVSHTKDDINWNEDEEEQVEQKLAEELGAYIRVARTPRKGQPPEHGPQEIDIDAAMSALEQELSAPEFIDMLSLADVIPDNEQIAATRHHVVENAQNAQPRLQVRLNELTVKVYLDSIGSPNDPYYVNEEKDNNEVIIVVNVQHPHWSMLEGDNAIANYLRHCVYDGVAEFRASQKSRLEPSTIKQLKDQYLRVAFNILQSGDD